MSLAPNQFCFPVDCLASLSGGRAADGWVRELAGKTQWVAATSNSCEWLNELVEIDLRVSRYPLFGHSLTLLANRESPNSAAPELPASRTPNNVWANGEQKSSAKTRANLAARDAFNVSSQDTESNRSTAGTNDVRSSTLTERILRLQPQSDVSLLRRHAGENSSFGNVDDHAGTPKIEPPRDRVRLPDDLCREVAPEALLERAGRRAERAWFSEARDGRDFDRFAIDTQAKSANSPSFAEDWSKTVTGVRASPELLTLLADSGTGLNGGFPGFEDGKRFSNSATGSTTTALGSSPHLIEPQIRGSSVRHKQQEEAQWPPERTKRVALTRVESPSRDHAVDTTSLFASPSWPRTVHETEEWLAENRIAPPTSAPSPDTLRPPRDPNVPVSPVAAMTIQRQAKAEEASAQGDDLALLAVKLERLLNQEARRHGIDV